ncbi:AAA family ATPase [Gordonia humi]|uniref:AAA family ATPase n=1 Tax=Gordonia humi TaxID=686429 RepID=UPI00361F1E5A
MAPTADAAQVLAADIGRQTDTLDKYAHIVRALDAAGDDENERARILESAPEWFTTIGPGTVILIDEVGMASTCTLDPVVHHALAAGADIKAVGDDQQLASVAAGGVLRDVAELGDTLTLHEVMRFADPTEGKASLALREGNDEAIGYYIDHQRVHVTADTVAAEAAYTAWRTDIQAGHASVLLAPTGDTVRALNQRARADRLADTPPTLRDKLAGRTRELTLADGLAASVGDTIRTRRNDRRLRLSSTDFVRNGYRWTIEKVGTDGTLTVRHERSNARIILPADYVAEHCELGYAGTIHSAQGMTVGSRGKQQGTCHIVGADSLDRQMLYVAMTRGVDANHLYLGTSEADPHKIIFDRAQRPPTAVDMLRQIIDRDGRQTSASTIARTDSRAATHLAHAADSYATAVAAIAETHLGTGVMTAIDHAADTLHLGLTEHEGWPALRKQLAAIALSAPDGVDPATHAAEQLHTAIGRRELSTATDAAAVISWRLDPTTGTETGGPLPWLPEIPAALAEHPQYGDYLARRAELVGDLARSVRDEAADHRLPWQARTAGIDRELVADVAVFRAAHNIADSDHRPLGDTQLGTASRRAQDALADRLGNSRDTDTGRWEETARRIDPHLLDDLYWPELARHLDTADQRGIDVEPILERAATDHMLPTETPASALYWRMADDLAADPIDAARVHLDSANTALADHRLAALAPTVGVEHTTRWGASDHRDDLSTALAAAHATTGMAPEHLLAAAGTTRADAEVTARLRGLAGTSQPRLAPTALPGDDPTLIEAATTAHERYRALIAAARTDLDRNPPHWLTQQLGTRPASVDGANAWDAARTALLDYHAEYGRGDEALPALPATASPAQTRAHTLAADRLERVRRQEHIDRLTQLEHQRQQHLVEQERRAQEQHLPPPDMHHNQGRHM